MYPISFVITTREIESTNTITLKKLPYDGGSIALNGSNTVEHIPFENALLHDQFMKSSITTPPPPDYVYCSHN